MAATTFQVRTGQRIRVFVAVPGTAAVLSRAGQPSTIACATDRVLTAECDGPWTVVGGTIACDDIDDVIDDPRSTCARTYSLAGELLTEAYTLDSVTYTKTYTWVGGNLTAESAWVVS